MMAWLLPLGVVAGDLGGLTLKGRLGMAAPLAG